MERRRIQFSKFFQTLPTCTCKGENFLQNSFSKWMKVIFPRVPNDVRKVYLPQWKKISEKLTSGERGTNITRVPRVCLECCLYPIQLPSAAVRAYKRTSEWHYLKLSLMLSLCLPATISYFFRVYTQNKYITVVESEDRQQIYRVAHVGQLYWSFNLLKPKTYILYHQF